MTADKTAPSRELIVFLIGFVQLRFGQLFHELWRGFLERDSLLREEPFGEMKIIFRRERERDRPGCRHRRPADGFWRAEIEAMARSSHTRLFGETPTRAFETHALPETN
jgi:hypothetical protein